MQALSSSFGHQGPNRLEGLRGDSLGLLSSIRLEVYLGTLNKDRLGKEC